MQHVTANTARSDFDALLSRVISRGDSVSIATDEGAAVLVSAEEWNELRKARHNAAYLAMIDKSARQAEDGRTIAKTIEELEDLAK